MVLYRSRSVAAEAIDRLGREGDQACRARKNSAARAIEFLSAGTDHSESRAVFLNFIHMARHADLAPDLADDAFGVDEKRFRAFNAPHIFSSIHTFSQSIHRSDYILCRFRRRPKGKCQAEFFGKVFGGF